MPQAEKSGGGVLNSTAALNTQQDKAIAAAKAPGQIYDIPAFAPKTPAGVPQKANGTMGLQLNPAAQPAVANPAQQFAGVTDPKAAPAKVTGQFTGDNGLTAPTSTHFNPVTQQQPFNPKQMSAQDLAWFRKETGTKFNPKSIADVNYFMNRRRNNQTQIEADAMERQRRQLAPQNAADNTAQLNRLIGR